MGRAVASTVLLLFLAATLAGCSGGFGTDSGNADELAPPFFGSDDTSGVAAIRQVR
jgi:hypothetical protein